MNIQIYDEYYLNDEWIKQEVFHLMQLCDEEFFPPMSTRGSGTPYDNLCGVWALEMNRHFIYAIDEEDPNNPVFVGYMAYEDDHVAEQSNNGQPCRYVIRVIVNPDYRGNGLTDSFYDYLARISSGYDGFGVRTWTTNYSHLKVLERCGFVEDGRIVNDRGDGIDSVYFWKSLV